MAFNELTPTEQQQVKEFLRQYRAAVADTVRGLRQQELLKMSYDASISSLWAQIDSGDLIEDGSGLAGADLTMTKADFTPKFTWTSNLLAGVYSDNGGAVATVWVSKETVDSYGVQLAGLTNL